MAGERPINDADDLVTLTGTESFIALDNAEGLILVPAATLRAYINGLATAPTDILLDDATEGPEVDGAWEVAEGQATGTELFTLTAVDSDAGDTHTFSIVSGNELGLFAIDGNKIEVADDIVAEDVASVTLGLQVTDSAGFTMAAPKEVTFLIRLVPAALPVLSAAAVLPVISPTVANEFLATAPTFTADEDDTVYDHQWMIDLTVEIVSATSLAYVPVEGDVGRKLRLRTRATARGQPPVETFSAETLVVVAGSGPTITALVASDPTDTTILLRHPAQTDATRYQYRWRVSSLSYGSGVFLTPSNVDVQGSIKEIRVSGLTESTLYTFQYRWQKTDSTYSLWEETGSTSNQVGTTGVIAAPGSAPVLQTAPTLTQSTTGAPRPGTVIGGDNGVWLNNPTTMTFAYRYLRVDSAGTETAISSATSSTYTVVTGDIGFRIRREVTASNSVGPGEPHKSTPTEIVVAAPTSGIPSEGLQIELAPPNLIDPRTVSIGASNENTRTITISDLQDAIITAPSPTAGRRGRDYITGGAQKWCFGINFGAAMTRFRNFRGEQYVLGCEWDGRFAPEVDPFWIDTQIAANGLPHRVTRAGSRVLPPPGTWYSHSALFILSASCSGTGNWSISAVAPRGVRSAKLPERFDVLEIIGGTNVNARSRWIRIDTVTAVGGGNVDYTFTITGTDVTESRASNSPLLISTTYARTGYAIREFRCNAGVIELEFVGIQNVESGSSGKGVILNQVYKANGDRFHRASTVYHITAWDSATQTATLQLRVGDTNVSGVNFTIPGSKVKAAYYDSRHFRLYDITPHADCIQVLDHSLPVEIRDLFNRRIFTYQVIRHNGKASLYRDWKNDTSRIDTYEMPEIFPCMLESQGLDMQNYGATLGMIREWAGGTRWEPDEWRDLQSSQVSEPSMVWTDGTQTAVAFASGANGSIGSSGSIAKWTDIGDENIAPGEAYTNTYTFAMTEADAAPSAVTFRRLTTADVRNAAQNTPLFEIFIAGPRRGIVYNVTLTDTSGSRFQRHSIDGGLSRCIAKGATALAASTTYTTTMRIVSNAISGRTAGHTKDFTVTIITNSAGGIASVSAVAV